VVARIAGGCVVAVVLGSIAASVMAGRGPARASEPAQVSASTTTASIPASTTGASSAPSTKEKSDSARIARLVEQVPARDRPTCRAQVSALVCAPLDGPDRVEYRLLTDPAQVRQVVGELGAGLPAPARGPAECEAGRAERRTWSRPAAPDRAVGTYGCIPGRPATLWWTENTSGLVATAESTSGDLGAVFAWWRANAAL
jgi:hypothetical protein